MTHRALRVLAHVAAVAALLVLGFRPTRRVRVPAGDVIVATPGAAPDAVRRLADSAGAKVVRIPGDEADVAALRRHRAGIRSVTVAGWGLDEAELAELRGIAIIPGPASPAPGVTHLSWPATVVLGDPLAIEGRGARPQTRVRLSGPAGPADSGTVDANGRFRVADLPRDEGRHLYVLRVEGAAPETLGVHVTRPAPPRVLILAAAPSFETRALRDWLARAGGVVALRTAVSRERWHTEFVNRPAMDLVSLTAAALAQFDVAVTDSRTLDDLPTGERAALDRAVRESGIGLVVGASNTPPPMSLGGTFVTSPIPDLGERSVRPVLAGVTPARLAVPAAPAALAERFAVETVVQDGAGVAIVQATPRGAGTVALSLVDGTSRWLRGGEPDVYAAFWSRVLRRAARAAPTWRAAEGPHTVHHPVPISGPASGDAAVVVSAPSGARDTVSVAPDPLDAARARGIYWPREPGWHEVGGQAFHVSGPDAWADLTASARLRATARAAARGPLPGDRPPASREERRPLPLAWALVVFVLATGYLWAMRR